jgi:hypothetical protein
MIRDSISISDENENNQSGTFITRNALYGTYGVLSFYCFNEMFEVVNFQVEFAPAVSVDSGAELQFSTERESGHTGRK